jgi:hypothetical protein
MNSDKMSDMRVEVFARLLKLWNEEYTSEADFADLTPDQRTADFAHFVANYMEGATN